MVAPMKTTTYSEWLAQKLDENGYTVRSFARVMNPENPEVARRSLRRYLKGMVPIERTRSEIAGKLGTKELGPDDDSEGD